MRRTHLWVTGRVQGVWFRESMRRAAEANGVAGWVRNLPDGRVEAVVEGDDADVAQVVAWCRRGPERAQVERVDCEDEEPTGVVGFEVRK